MSAARFEMNRPSTANSSSILIDAKRYLPRVSLDEDKVVRQHHRQRGSARVPPQVQPRAVDEGPSRRPATVTGRRGHAGSAQANLPS